MFTVAITVRFATERPGADLRQSVAYNVLYKMMTIRGAATEPLTATRAAWFDVLPAILKTRAS